MALTYLKIFADMEETLALYSDEERGRLLSAMMAYSFRGEEPEFTGAERFVWPMLRNHIDSCEAQSEKQKANGKRNMKVESQTEPNEANASQTKPNEAKPSQTEPIQEQEQDQDHEQEHVHDQDHKSTRGKRARFVPPTPEEVQAYFLANSGNRIQSVRFHAYYGSNGWKVGKNPMKDWQAAARGWISRDKEGGYAGGASASGQKAAPGSAKSHDTMLRYTQEERKKAYSAAVVSFDEED